LVIVAGIHLGGHASRHDLQDLAAEDHADLIEGLAHHLLGRCSGAAHIARFLQGAVDQALVGGDLGRRQDQRGVGGGIPRRELFDRVNVAGVGHHHGHGSELIEQIGHG
jgi:GMP synthase-like glutamine amidotransferase